MHVIHQMRRVLMKRTRVVAVLLVALALVGLAAPLAYAQAPAPKVTINGLIDQVMSYSRNISNQNTGLFNHPDNLWYSRTRGRFDVTGEIGKAKAVLGIEIDTVWGQTGSVDNNQVGLGAGKQSFGTTSSWDLNTDTQGVIEIKWLYTEFQVPLIPVPTVARLGAQPFGAAATYKISYATGDFAGVNVVSTVAPNVKLLGTYIQVEEGLQGTDAARNTTTPGASPTGILFTQDRGDDHAWIVSAEVSPFKGFDIKPMISGFWAQGTTSGSARAGRGGVNTSTAYTNTPGSQAGANEQRYTVGFDSRFRMVPFSLDPTVLYQFGQRNVFAVCPSGVSAAQCADAGLVGGRKYRADIDAWFIDIRGGFQLGPLLLQAIGVYSTGNGARNSTLGTVRYFQPLSVDTGYQADWGNQLTGLGIDYLNAWNEAGGRIAYPGAQIGWDKYGRAQVGVKATYAITPALSIMAGANVHWTAEEVDREGTPAAGAGIFPAFARRGGQDRDNSRYVGTEFFAILGWRFAPGLSWDNAIGYMSMGSALDAVTDPTYQRDGYTGRNTNDPFIYTSRIRFTF
jgi:hypothetical protein